MELMNHHSSSLTGGAMRSRRTVLISRALSALGVAGCMLALSASPAQAQLGRLKKAAEEAAKKKAGLDKTEETAKKVDEAKEDASITVERIDAVVAVLQPMVAAAERKAAAAAAEAEYEREKKVATSCLEAFGKSGVMPTGMMGEKYAKIVADVQATNDRAQKAMQAGNYRTAIATGDSATVMQVQSMGVIMNAKCKAYPHKPAAMISLEAQNLEDASNGKMARSESGGSGSLEVPSNNRGGMSTRLFGRTRERIALYGLLASRAITTNQAGKEGVFSDAERAALDSRKDIIAKMTPVFQTNGLQWKSWEDLKSW